MNPSTWKRLGGTLALVAVALASYSLGQIRANHAEAAAGAEATHAGEEGHDHAAEAAAQAGDVVTLTPDRVAAAGITTAAVAMAPVAAQLSLNGEVQADGNLVAKVGSPVSGRITSLAANVGATVHKGQVLAVVAGREIAEAQAAAVRARADESAAQGRLDQVRALAAMGALTQKPLEEAENALAAARAGAAQADATLARTQTARDLATGELGRRTRMADSGAYRARPLDEARAGAARSVAELETAQATVKVKQVAYDRSTRLLTAGIASRREVETARYELDQATAHEREARTHQQIAADALSREEEFSRQNLYTVAEVQAAQAALQQANKEVEDREAERIRARAQLKLATAVVERERAIAARNLPARRELQEARTALLRAQADRAAAAGALAAFRSAGGASSGPVSILVTSPIDGVVTERAATPGQAVQATADLFTVVGNDSVWVWADVYEKDMPNVRNGQPARVSCSAHPTETWEGRVGMVGTQANEQTRSIRVRVDLPNPHGLLRPGMFVTVSLGLRQQAAAPAVPVPAVQQMDGNYVVFVAGKPGSYSKRTVRVGARTGSSYEVLGGLKVGESVVTRNAFLLKSELMKDQLSEGCAD